MRRPALVVDADPTQLRQALLNLALNAIQAMPHGRHADDQLRGRARRPRAASASETPALGIPPEHLARIFDLYFTTKRGGTGIGLSMVFRTVQIHNGDIDVESTLGVGTTFTISLPRAA